jgi:hypothetical protein
MSPEELKEFCAGIKEIIPPVIEYRFHYDDNGAITMCSMVDHPDSTQYIVVTREEYDQYFDYTIVNNQLKKIDRDAGYRVQLERSTRGYPVVRNHAGLLLEPTEPYNDIEYYARRNN